MNEPASVAAGPPLWLDAAAGQPRIGVIRNPRSHGNRARHDPADNAAKSANVAVRVPNGRAEIAPILRRFADGGIECLMVDGGDGTVRDILTAGLPIFGERWPRLAVLPRGKTNALTEDLGIRRDWTLDEAVAAAAGTRTTDRQPLRIETLGQDRRAVAGFIMGAGAFTLGVKAAQDAHRLGAFGGLAVALTGLWGAAQMIFGGDRNPWRRGVVMDITLLPGREAMPHSGHGEHGRRSIMLATTLDTMPMKLAVFGPPRRGLKIAAIDRPRRLMWALMPAFLKGWQPRWLADWGYHRIAADGFLVTLGDGFILDGELFPAGAYRVTAGPPLTFVLPIER